MNERPRTRFVALFGLCWLLSGCSQSREAGEPSRSAAYVVFCKVNRASDQKLLTSVSAPLRLNRTTVLRIGDAAPAENEPSLPVFMATLTRTMRPGVLQLVTRLTVREALRNKKGKLKVSKRYIGALLPIRPGESMVTSVESDPMRVEVRLERR